MLDVIAAACINCHIMQPQFDSWQKASHHTFATCVDCHLPHDFVGKYIAKAENGYLHSRAFTLQDFAEPIRITAKNSRILHGRAAFEDHEAPALKRHLLRPWINADDPTQAPDNIVQAVPQAGDAVSDQQLL